MLLSTFLVNHLQPLENQIRRQGEHPDQFACLAALRWDEAALRAVADRLNELDGPEFLIEAARWLVALDRSLGDSDPRVLSFSGKHTGVDGHEYVVRHRNSYFGDLLDARGRSTWAGTQSISVAAYTRRTTVVPVAPAGGICIKPVPLARPAHQVDERLRYERDQFVAVLAPLGRIAFPDPSPTFVSLREPANVDEVAQDAEQAIAHARDVRATILVLPELCASAGVLDRVFARLAEHGPSGHPILTVVGLCHQPDASGELDVNECLLLGPDGAELHRHRKITNFSSERLQVGDAITVIESSLGNLSLLICLDLINLTSKAALVRSHASVLLVPSLSDQTRAHDTAATDLAVAILASTFVCNRRLDGGFAAASASLWRLPGGHSERDSGAAPYFVFRLADLLS